jgi:hypothetical protein
MHDFLEGICPFGIKLFFREILINQKHFNFSDELINSGVRLFEYGRSDLSNKPSGKFKNGKKTQRAAQSWCLIRMFPLLFGDIFPEGHPHYSFILLLLSIMDIIFAPVLTPAHSYILEELISQFYFEFNYLFPGVNPINKFHHLIHYPDIIRQHGPPIRYWCMRYEAFQGIVKRKAQLNCNFKNISKSISNHLQSVFAANLQNDNRFSKFRFEFGPSKIVPYADLMSKYSLVDSLNLNRESEILEPSWVSINGWEYYPKSVVVVKKSHETPTYCPEFAQIKTLLVQDNFYIFAVASNFESCIFDEHYHAFELSRATPERSTIIHLNVLPECEPLYILKTFSANSFEYVAPRHII